MGTTTNPGPTVATRKSTCSVSIRLVWPFVALVPRHERAKLTARLQAHFGLKSSELLDPDTRVPLQVASDLLSRSIEQTGKHDIGLTAARHVTTEHISIVEYLARSTRTIGEALAVAGHYLRLLCDGMHHSIESRDGKVFMRFWFDSNLALHAAAYEFAVATGVYTAIRIAGAQLALAEVHFMHQQPHNLSTHRQLFKCPLRFGMPITQVGISAKVLALPLSTADSVLASLLKRQADAMVLRLPTTNDFASKVRDMIAAETDLAHVSASRFARLLGISVRSLARRLSDQSTGFRTLLDEVRMQIALRELSQTQRPLDHIAHQLGFASSQSFHRAFRRWTGCSATNYRERARWQRTSVTSGTSPALE